MQTGRSTTVISIPQDNVLARCNSSPQPRNAEAAATGTSGEQLSAVQLSTGLSSLRESARLAALCVGKRAILFDFDGTIAEAEQLHHASYCAAIEELTGLNAEGSSYPFSLCSAFSPMFGLDEMGSCRKAVQVLENVFSDAFAALLQNSGSSVKELETASAPERREILEQCAVTIKLCRDRMVKKFCAAAVLLPTEASGEQILKVSNSAWESETVDAPWLAHMRGVEVTLQPGIRELISAARAQNPDILFAVVTSSGRFFTLALLEAFHLVDRFSAGVFAEHAYPLIKPRPEPWRIALRLLNSQRGESPYITASKVLVLENGCESAISALLAGADVALHDASKSPQDMEAAIYKTAPEKVLRRPLDRRRIRRFCRNAEMESNGSGGRESARPRLHFPNSWLDIVPEKR